MPLPRINLEQSSTSASRKAHERTISMLLQIPSTPARNPDTPGLMLPIPEYFHRVTLFSVSTRLNKDSDI